MQGKDKAGMVLLELTWEFRRSSVYTVSAFSLSFGIAAVIFECTHFALFRPSLLTLQSDKSGMILYRHRKVMSDLYRQSNGTVSFGALARLVLFSLLPIFSVGWVLGSFPFYLDLLTPLYLAPVFSICFPMLITLIISFCTMRLVSELVTSLCRRRWSYT